MPKNKAVARFFRTLATEGTKVTFDDVRLETSYSEIDPASANVSSRFSRHIKLGIPLVSSPMDRVTTAPMAIAMAEAGGLGIIHRALSPEAQAEEVRIVKNRLNARIDHPVIFTARETLAAVLERRKNERIPYHSFPVVDDAGKMIGMLFRSIFRLHTDTSKTLGDIMVPLGKLQTGSTKCTVEEAHLFMLKNPLQPALPLLYENGEVAGLYAPADVVRTLSPEKPSYNLDKNGHLRVGAAVGAGEGALRRAELLSQLGCDVFQVDTAHGNSRNVVETIQKLKKLYPKIDVAAGNVSSGDGAKRLVDAGADAVLVGQGSGSICTTRIVAGIGVPQVSAVYECVEAIADTDVPVCSDGGIRNSGDMVIALAIGASSIMLGRLLSGTEESPGEKRLISGVQYKDYRGMGSLGAMRENQSSRERYGQGALTVSKLVPEGIEGVVPYQGPVRSVLDQHVGGIKAGLGYHGASKIPHLVQATRIFRMSRAGMAESHPHDVMMTVAAPNYSGR